MKFTLRLVVSSLTAVAVLAAFSGCASIVNGGPAKISMKSVPSGARVTVYDHNGVSVTNAITPVVLRLDRGRGYFKSAHYRIEVAMDGYRTTQVELTSTMNGWYWGNLLFGGLIGMIVVDPLTGSMYTLSPKNVDVALAISQAEVSREEGAIVVVLRENLPDNLQAALVPLVPN